jgi:hypothetical protein
MVRGSESGGHPEAVIGRPIIGGWGPHPNSNPQPTSCRALASNPPPPATNLRTPPHATPAGLRFPVPGPRFSFSRLPVDRPPVASHGSRPSQACRLAAPRATHHAPCTTPRPGRSHIQLPSAHIPSLPASSPSRSHPTAPHRTAVHRHLQSAALPSLARRLVPLRLASLTTTPVGPTHARAGSYPSRNLSSSNQKWCLRNSAARRMELPRGSWRAWIRQGYWAEIRSRA